MTGAVRGPWGVAGGPGTGAGGGVPGGDIQAFPAQLFDGRSAQPHNVTVVPALEGLRILDPQGRLLETWLYEDLVSSGPLLPGQPTTVGVRNRSGIRLHVAAPVFGNLLLQRAPQLSGRAHRARLRREVWTTLGVVAALIVVFFLLPIPWARMGAALVPDAFWSGLGEKLRPLLAREVCTDPDGAEALEALRVRLNEGLEAAGYAALQTPVEVGRMSMVNAFTLPGGRIVISSALIREAESPEEVAGVLAHEIGHALARHPEAGVIRGIGLTGLVSVLTGGSVLADQIMKLVMLKYSRNAEREADQLTMEILKGAEVDPAPLAGFFERLIARHGRGGLAVLSTHPPSDERMETFQRLSGQWPTRPVLDEAEWQALRDICR